MKTDKLVEKIRKALVSTDQVGLFSNEDPEKELKEACVEYLKFVGYKVVPGPNYKTHVNDIYSLISYFYQLLDGKKFKHIASPAHNRNFGRDLSVAKSFIEARKAAAGFSDELAIKECAKILETFFEHIDEFNIKGPIRFELFAQVKMAWVTEKAVQIMVNKASLLEERLNEIEQINLERELSKDYQDSFDLDSILERMNQEEINNGKK